MQLHRHILRLLLLLLTLFPQSSRSQSRIANLVSHSSRVNDSVMHTDVSYYDGLGYGYLSVSEEVTQRHESLAVLTDYDGLRRDSRHWLPVVTNSDYLHPSQARSLPLPAAVP